MIDYKGSVSIGGCVPGITAALSLSLSDLQAKLTALLAVTVSLGQIDFAASLTLSLEIVANIQAALAIGITPPSISAQLAIFLSLIGAIKIQIELLLHIQSLLLKTGLDVYTYAGPVNSLGPEFSAELAAGLPSGGTGATNCNAILLVTSLGDTWAALQGIFLT